MPEFTKHFILLFVETVFSGGIGIKLGRWCKKFDTLGVANKDGGREVKKQWGATTWKAECGTAQKS